MLSLSRLLISTEPPPLQFFLLGKGLQIPPPSSWSPSSGLFPALPCPLGDPPPLFQDDPASSLPQASLEGAPGLLLAFSTLLKASWPFSAPSLQESLQGHPKAPSLSAADTYKEAAPALKRRSDFPHLLLKRFCGSAYCQVYVARTGAPACQRGRNPPLLGFFFASVVRQPCGFLSRHGALCRC